MSRYIGHITEESWPEARSILVDAFRVDYRTTPDRYAGHVEGYNVWVEAEDLHTEPWWEELLQVGWDGRVVWRVEGQGYGDGEL